MANVVRIVIEAEDKISGAIDKIHDKALLLSKTDIGKGMLQGAGIAAFGMVKNAAMGALDSVVQFGLGSVEAASALNETMSKSAVIFGDNSDAVAAWGATMAEAGGLSKRAALDAASGFAGLFQTVGISADKSVAMSEKLVQMGSDLASFFNTDVDQALQALKSGLNGESEPLRKFNVFLSETAVTAKLAEMGVKKVGGAFTEEQKATARYALILEQTGAAQGDYARTADQLANTQRTLQAEMENVQAEIGQQLLPVMKDLSSWALDEGVPALRAIIGALKDSDDAIRVLAFVASMGGSELSRAMKDAEDAAADASMEFTNLGDIFEDVIPPTARWRGMLNAAKSSVGDLGGAAREAREPVRKIGRTAGDAADEFDDLTDTVNDAVDALITASFAPEQLALEIKIATQNTKDLEHELKDMTDGRGRPLKGHTWKEVNEIKLQISESKEETRKLQYRFDTLNGTDMGDVTKATKGLSGSLGTAAARAATLLDRLNHISRITFGRYEGKPLPENAAGGYIPPYGTSVIGEHNAETITLGSMGGYVNPSASAASGTGGGVPVSIPIYLDGRVLAEVVDRHLYYVAAAAPQSPYAG